MKIDDEIRECVDKIQEHTDAAIRALGRTQASLGIAIEMVKDLMESLEEKEDGESK